MPLQRPRSSSVLATALAAAGIMLAVASCAGHITPLGPTPAVAHTNSMTESTVRLYKLGSPIILQVMQSQSPTAAGACPAGSIGVSLPPGAAPMPCYRPLGTPVALTSAGVSTVATVQSAPAPGQPAQPASYRLMVGVLPTQVAAVTALITQAYDSREALGVSVDGTLWEAPEVLQPLSGQQLEISLLSRNQALELYRLLVSTG